MATISDNIIDALGGTTAVHRLAETPLSTVHSWRKNGVPPSRMAHLRLIAKEAGIDIDWETGERVDHDPASTCADDKVETGNARDLPGYVEAQA